MNTTDGRGSERAPLRFSPAPAEVPELGPRDVHLWRAVVRVLPPEGPGLLSPEEQARAHRLPEEDRARFVLARTHLRCLLAAYTGIPPAGIVIAAGAQGKPFVPDVPVRFNASHSGELVLLAFARERAVGVDVEASTAEFDPLPLAERYFSRAEAEELRALPREDRRGQFQSLWSRKEALLKARGIGLPDGLDEPPRHADFEVFELEVGPTASAFVAVEGKGLAPAAFDAPTDPLAAWSLGGGASPGSS